MDISARLKALLNRTRDPASKKRPGRLAPDRPLPPYAFVPRHFPHPVRDPRGHSHGIEPDFGTPPTVDAPLLNPEFCYSLDLFNCGYYWEAHEGFEAYWMACPEGDPRRLFFQGLLRLAAAGVKARGGLGRGVASHATKAAALFRAVDAQVEAGLFLGFLPKELGEQAEDLALRAYSFKEAEPMPKVEVILPIVLDPKEAP